MAKEWGLTPSEFWDLSSDDQALMIALIEVNSEMAEYERYEHDKKLEKATRPGPRSRR